MRRGALVVIAVAVVLAGCSGGGTRTPQSIEATAAQATVGGSTLSETGFTDEGVERVRVNRSGTLQIAGDVQMSLGYRVNATGWRATYRDGPRVFALYTVPDAKPDNVAARIDPLGDRSTAEIVAGAQDTYAVESLSHRENRTATVLGSERTVRRYDGSATANGTVEVTVSVVTVAHENDVVRAVAVVPADADAWPTVERLLAGVSH
jgi:hypothetical protein